MVGNLEVISRSHFLDIMVGIKKGIELCTRQKNWLCERLFQQIDVALDIIVLLNCEMRLKIGNT